MKKRYFFLIIIIFPYFATFADSFTDAIQDLAIQTACIGKYSATQAGGGWYDDCIADGTYYNLLSRLEEIKNEL